MRGRERLVGLAAGAAIVFAACGGESQASNGNDSSIVKILEPNSIVIQTDNGSKFRVKGDPDVTPDETTIIGFTLIHDEGNSYGEVPEVVNKIDQVCDVVLFDFEYLTGAGSQLEGILAVKEPDCVDKLSQSD